MAKLTSIDVKLHIKDLVELGEDPHTPEFWDRVRMFIAAFAAMQERITLIHLCTQWSKDYL